LTSPAGIDLLKPTDVTRRLGVSRSWLYAAAADGRIPAIRLGGAEGPLRFVPEDLERWIEEARAAWTPAASNNDVLRNAARNG
jgi:excisionase family DNA binding protein